MGIEIREVRNSADHKAFVALPDRLYAGDPAWIAPLRMMVNDTLSPKHNRFFDHGEAQLFLAFRDGRVVGRISAQQNRAHNERHQDKRGFFGFFESENDPDVARALVRAAADWCEKRGLNEIAGPMDFSINEEIGVLVKGFDKPPYVLTKHSLPYYGNLLEQAGLAKIKDVFGWSYEPGKPLTRLAERAYNMIKSRNDVRFRDVDMSRFHDEIRIVMDIFNDAWGDNWGFVPLTERETEKVATDLKLLIDPRIAFIVEIEGKPIAMCIGVPNLNEAVRDFGGRLWPWNIAKLIWRLKFQGVRSGRLMLLGIRKEYQRFAMGALSAAMYAEVRARAHIARIEQSELGWTLEDNEAINKGIAMMGAEPYKTWRIYGAPLPLKG
ncbi:MAG: hypothetical protein GMKNLPBB_01902 [Myxococcota bacterium]|nr:hypothetical protein [Myxococcota bacterium]